MTRDLRLAPTALVVWGAAWCLTGVADRDTGDGPAGTVLAVALVAGTVTLGCLALACLTRVRRVRRTVVTHLLLVGACLVALAVSVHGQAVARSPLPQLAAAGAVATVHGTVVSEPRPATFGDAERWVVAVSEVWSRGTGSTARGHVEVTAPGPAPRYGARVVADVRLGPPGIGAGTVAAGDATSVETVHPPGAVLRTTDTLREALLEVTDDLSPQARGLVPGAAVGDTTRLPDDLDEAMRTTGLTHVTAVSGSHFAIVVAALTAACVLLRVPRSARVVLLALGAVGFVLLVRPEPSVLRAAWTCAVALLALALGRPSSGPPALAVASTVLLVVDPWMSRSFGFALSCAATAGIVLLTGPIVRRLAPWCGRAAAFAVAVPLAAQAACGPVLILLDPALPAVAVPANLLAAPALVPATVLGLLATLLAPWAPVPAGVVAGAAGIATAWIAAVARFFAGLPGASLPWPGGVGGAALLAAGTTAVLWVALRRPPGRGWRRAPAELLVDAARRALRPPDRRAGLPARRLLGVVCVAVIAATGALVGPRFVAGTSRTIPEDWQVVACDVGQGDTLVIRSGARAAVVVDVGPPGDVAARCLSRLGVDRIDLLVLSHFHTDHVGGLDAVLSGRTVRGAVVSPLDDPATPARRARQSLAAAGVPVVVGSPGQEGMAGTTAWRVLAAHTTIGGAAGGANDASVVLTLRTRSGIDVVTLGDLERPGQEELVRLLGHQAFADGAVEVLKMAHHGSASQSADLATLLAPQVTLVPVGENTYGHPADSALAMYEAVGSRTVRTDECGTAALALRRGVLVLTCTRGR